MEMINRIILNDSLVSSQYYFYKYYVSVKRYKFFRKLFDFLGHSLVVKFFGLVLILFVFHPAKFKPVS